MEDTASGLPVRQLLKMFANGDIDLATFKQLTKQVVGCDEEVPIDFTEDDVLDKRRAGAVAATQRRERQPAQGGGQTGGLADAKRRGHEGARGGARAAGWDARVGRKATRVGARTW